MSFPPFPYALTQTFLIRTYLPFLDPSKVVMDKQMFESSHYQRVYQYLQRYTRSVNLDQFSYGDNIEGTPDSCLETILW